MFPAGLRALLALRHRPIAWGLRALAARAAPPPIEPEQIERILVIRNDEIGDFVLTTPFLRELRKRFPRSTITLVVKSSVRSIAEKCPYVNQVLLFDATSGPRGAWPGAPEWRAARFAGDSLAGRQFDLAVVPRWDVDAYGASALAWLSRARLRIGYSESVTKAKALRNAGYDALFTHVLDERAPLHESLRPLALLRFLGVDAESDGLEAWTSSADEAFAETQVATLRAPRIAIAPGAGSPHRRWPAARFAAVALILRKRLGASFVLVGGAGDRADAALIAAVLSGAAIDLTGRADLAQTCAVLRRCALFVGNDSGPMHLAAAAGAPVIEVSCHPRSGSDLAAHSPLRFGPRGTANRILRPARARSPCAETCSAKEAHCIIDVPADEVAEAAAALFAETSRGG